MEVRFVEQSSAVLMIGFVARDTASQISASLVQYRGYSCASKGRVVGSGPDLDFDQTLAG